MKESRSLVGGTPLGRDDRWLGVRPPARAEGLESRGTDPGGDLLRMAQGRSPLVNDARNKGTSAWVRCPADPETKPRSGGRIQRCGTDGVKKGSMSALLIGGR
jgi:hypothetical protein